MTREWVPQSICVVQTSYLLVTDSLFLKMMLALNMNISRKQHWIHFTPLTSEKSRDSHVLRKASGGATSQIRKAKGTSPGIQRAPKVRVPSLPFLCLFPLRGVICHNISKHTRQNPELAEKKMSKRTREPNLRKRPRLPEAIRYYDAPCWAGDTSFTNTHIGNIQQGSPGLRW